MVRKLFMKENEQPQSEESWARYISRLCDLTDDEESMLLSDLYNLRADEWLDTLIDCGVDNSIISDFKEFFNIEDDEEDESLVESIDEYDSIVVTVPGLYTYNENDVTNFIDWCCDYLSEYELEAYIIDVQNSSIKDKVIVYYDIEDLSTTSQEEVEDVIKQAVNDFIANA